MSATTRKAARASVVAARENVPAELKAKWAEAFNGFDKNNSGKVDAQELVQVMESLRMAPAAGEVEAMITAVDNDGDQAINYDEFELMMVAAGRGQLGQVGFSHIVQRHITMKETSQLMTAECAAFVDTFCRAHVDKYMDLPSADTRGMEQSPSWFDTHKKFVEEAELNIQNLMILWGVASEHVFQEDFLDAAKESNILHDFLRYTEYPNFIQKMYYYVQQEQQGVVGGGAADCLRPTTPHSNNKTEKRISAIDRELSMMEMRRNDLLSERRRIIGCEVEPSATSALKRELEMRIWKDDVGGD